MDLVNYYSPETVRWKLQRMKAVSAFRPRMPLAEKALVDYEEERYHACVPVVLALLDGLVNELHEERRGFFSGGSLEAWDSVAAHSKGLNVISNIFQKGRRKTVTDQITIPYRNGILHGMDLGYDNKIVAAKTWAALFATRDWAIKAEKGLLKAQPEEPEPSWGELSQNLKELDEDKKRISEWRRRELEVGVNVPETGRPGDFAEGSPEQKLVEFLTLWQVKNYGFMAQCLDPKFGSAARKNPGEVRAIYGDAEMQSFILINIKDEAPAITEIHTNIIYLKNGEERVKLVKYRLVNSAADGTPQVRGKAGSHWGIINWNWNFF